MNNKTVAKFASLALLSSSCFSFFNFAKANPIESYIKEVDCWNRPDFISPKGMNFRYCERANDVIQKIDIKGVVLDEEIILNTLDKNTTRLPLDLRERKKKNKRNFYSRISRNLFEYRIEDNNLVKYNCESKRNRSSGNYECTKLTDRLLIGIRPAGFYYNLGLESQENGDWDKSITLFSKQIDANKSKDAYYQRARSKYYNKDYKGALDDLNYLVKSEYYPEYIYFLSSLVRNSQGNYPEELISLKNLLENLNAQIEEGKSNLNRIKDLNYFTRNDSAYLIVEGPTLAEAKQNSSKLGGTLAVINNYKENQWLVDNLSYQRKFYNLKDSGKYWIGNIYENYLFSKTPVKEISYRNWKIGSPELEEDYLINKKHAKITLLRSSNELRKDLVSRSKYDRKRKIIEKDIEDLNKYAGQWEIDSDERGTYLYGITEIKVAETFKQIDPLFKSIYFRIGRAKSELGDKRGSIKAFSKELEINPNNGQAYFERGLENYWKSRDHACTDIVKGLSLGAEDTSHRLIINGKEYNKTSLNQLSSGNYSLIKECSNRKSKKVETNQNNYQLESLFRKVRQITLDYFILIPAFAFFGFLIYIKYKRDDD